VSSVPALIEYYKAFKDKKDAGEHDLRIGTIFTYAANAPDEDADGLIGDPDLDPASGSTNPHYRERLDAFINDYNAMYQTAFSTKDSQSFYNYYKDLAKRMKEREKKAFKDEDRMDILLVVNMFLTGFDAKKLNTLYVDKNLKYHGLIQAYSRTNRILGQLKSQGNVVCFRNLKEKTDEAITLFSNKDAVETVLMAPYEEYVAQFNAAVETLKSIAGDVDAITRLETEEEILEFVRCFRDLIRTRNVLKSFTEFDHDDLDLTPQDFEDYKSKYLDIYDRTKTGDEGDTASIIDEVDFELELIQRDEINVGYILRLLAEAVEEEKSLDQHQRDQATQKRAAIMDLLGSEQQLRSKKELIQKFIDENMPAIPPGQSIEDAFAAFWTEEREAEIAEICKAEGLDAEAFRKMISEYHFTSKTPLSDTVIEALQTKPRILERKTVVERVVERLRDLIQTFDEGMG
jgi:type I restriction enzyme R subunit